MARVELTKSAVDAAKLQAQAIELRDTVVPGFLCKITPAGRKLLMLQCRTNAGKHGRQYDARRLGGVAVELKSHLPIERQVRVIGATMRGGGVSREMGRQRGTSIA